MNELKKKKELREEREKTADAVTSDVLAYNMLKRMKPVTMDDGPPPRRCCTII